MESLPDWEQTLDGRRVKHLYDQARYLRRDGLKGSHWLMSPEAYRELFELRDAYGVQIILEPEIPARLRLLGYPVLVRYWADIPTLIAQPPQY